MRYLSVVIACAALAATPGFAQDAPAPTAAETPPGTSPAPSAAEAPPKPSPTPSRPIDLDPGLGAPPEGIDRSSPRASVVGYLDTCRAGDYDLAAHYLFLNHLPRTEQASQGRRLARRLKFVLDQKLWVDLEAVNDTPQGAADDHLPADQDQIGAIALRGGEQAIRVQRIALEGGGHAWVFSKNVVRAIDPLYAAYGPGWIGDRLPPWMLRVRVWELELWQLFGLILAVVVADLARRLLAPVVVATVRGVARRTRVEWDDEMVEILPRPLGLFLWAVLVAVGSVFLHLAQPAQSAANLVVRSSMIAAVGLFGHRAVVVAARALQHKISEGVTDLRKLKGIKTRVTVIQRIGSGAVIFVAAATILAQFDVVRTVGVSLLASAGVAGIVLGFAAQRSVANLFAGIQIMLTEPIRIGDVVIVEGEWGNIEEITFTHVVVKIWDLRRLVVPISYFLEKPFQNWTRTSSELLGTIYFYTDHTVDLAAMRAELDRILAETPLWDGKAKGVIVTGLKDHVAEVRALISAADSGKQWDLRCLVREKLLDWLQREGKALPTLRLSMKEGHASRLPSGGGVA